MIIKSIIVFLLLLLPLGVGSQERYELTVDSALVIESLSVAKDCLGVIEKKENRHPAIDQWNLIIGNPLGSPYCQAGQYYTYFKAFQKIYGKPYDNHPVPRNGLAISTFNYAKQKGKKSQKYFAGPNDFIVWKQKSTTFGHIERIIKVYKKGWVETIGFNVSSQGKEGVFIKKRNIYMPLNRIKDIRGIVGIRYAR